MAAAIGVNMLKKEDRILIRTSLVEYRNLLFKAFKGTEEEKSKIVRINRLLQSWKAT
jgi:hypothetical protein